MLDLLKKTEELRLRRREELREEIRQRLRKALHDLVPGERVFLFASITRPNAFHEKSDVDIAFIREPVCSSIYGLQAKLEEMIGQPIDFVILSESRFREKIEREGELWTS